MSKIYYEDRSFTPAARDVVERAEQICDDYARQGYTLTLRQLYYRFIATNGFPDSRLQRIGDEFTKNHQRNYKWLGDLMTDARVAGLIDWQHLSDRTRSTEGGDQGYRDPAAAIDVIEQVYDIPHWPGQDNYVEVWVEKEALADVISRPANRWNVAWAACKGNPSSTLVHDAAQRFRRFERAGRKTHLVYLGDLDPTGVDIDRDIADRMRLFRSTVQVDRIALNMEQVEELDPPPSPVKATDSRANGYIDRFGTEQCWELDAIEPAALEALIEEAILSRLNRELYDARVQQGRDERRLLTGLRDNWYQVADYLRDNDLVPDPEEEEDDDEL